MNYLIATLLLLPSQVFSIQSGQPVCPLLFDGRIPEFAQTSDFDGSATPFYEGLKPPSATWSSILNFPQVPPSLFDRDFGSKSVEVQITDQSVVTRQGQKQSGYRRSELVIDDNSAAGVKTYHWSVRQGNWLNLTHLYLNVFVETRSQGHNFVVGLGELRGTPSWNWKVSGQDSRVVWQTAMIQNEWQNFAVTLDYNRNTMRVYYSKAFDLLAPVTPEIPNKNSRNGQFHVGVLKYPIGGNGDSKEGYQPKYIRDSQVYGGMFIEDGSNGCISNPLGVVEEVTEDDANKGWANLMKKEQMRFKIGRIEAEHCN